MPELSVHMVRIACRQRELLFDLATLFADELELRRVSVLHNQHLVFADGLRGVNLGALGCVIVPDNFLLWCDLAGACPAGKDNVAVGQQDRKSTRLNSS